MADEKNIDFKEVQVQESDKDTKVVEKIKRKIKTNMKMYVMSVVVRRAGQEN